MPEIAAVLPPFGNVFAALEGWSEGSVSALSASLTFAVFLAAVAVIVLCAAFALRAVGFLDDAKPVSRSVLAVSVCVPVLFVTALVLQGGGAQPEVRIAGATLAGFSSVVLAYLVVGSVEEGGKHLGLYGTGSYAEFANRGILYATFVALGFAFAENVLYLFTILRSTDGNASFFGTWFSRSVFSVGVHVLCSVAAAMPFVRAVREDALPARTVGLAMKGVLIAVALHAVFDVTVSYGKTGVVFLYAAIAYAVVTRAFYKPDSVPEDAESPAFA